MADRALTPRQARVNHVVIERPDAGSSDPAVGQRLAARLVAAQDREMGSLLAPRELVVIGSCRIEGVLLPAASVMT